MRYGQPQQSFSGNPGAPDPLNEPPVKEPESDEPPVEEPNHPNDPGPAEDPEQQPVKA